MGKFMRFLAIALVMALTLVLIPVSVFAASGTIRITVNGSPIDSDVEPFIDANDRTMVPVRFISEAMTADVDWDDVTSTVTVVRDTTVITLQIGSRELSINGAVILMDTEAVIKDDRTFVPVRFIAEALGLTVGWNEADSTVSLTTDDWDEADSTVSVSADGEDNDSSNQGMKVGDFSINVEKIPFAQPLRVEDSFSGFLTVAGGNYYVLSDKAIKQYKLVDGSFVLEKDLSDLGEFDYMSSDEKGTLYASRLFTDFMAFREGEQIFNGYDRFDRVTVHPSGDWGISWFVGNDVQLVWLAGDEIRYENVKYPEVGMISSLNINQNHIIISGTTQSEDTTAIFVYDENDDTLELTMGDKKDGEPGYMAFVKAVVETKNGYMAFDVNMRTILFWESDGTYIDTVNARDLLGTTYPWFCSAVLMPDGSVLVGLVDGPISMDSADEFVVYRLTGF